MNNYSIFPNSTTIRKLIFNVAVVLTILQFTSCEKESTVATGRTMQVWLHRVNTIGKAQYFQYAYTGFELDVHFDTTAGTFIVKHDDSDTSTLTLSVWLAAITDPGRLGFWLDFKNLDSLNKDKALAELLRIRQKFGLNRSIIVVESCDPTNLVKFDILNFRTSFYIPFFFPDSITPQDEGYYRDFIHGYIERSGIRTISGYSMQQGFMQKWFPEMNKLLWYLDSTVPAVKDSAIAAIRKDPTVEVLLVPENY